MVAELEQLALDPQVAPARVLPRHPHDQRREDVVNRWPSGPLGAGPSSADEAAMPAQDRVRGDQAMGSQCAGQPLDEGAEHGPVGQVRCAVVGLCDARMATSWRSTRSSMSLVKEERAISRSSPSICQKIK